MAVKDSRELDCLVAEHVFGWKWKSFIGIPVKGTEGYPQKCRVRRFFSPELLSRPEWVEFMAENEGRDVSKEEPPLPLDYSYFSSRGPEFVPAFSTYDDYEVLKFVRRNWIGDKRKKFASFLKQPMNYRAGDYSRAALKTLGVVE